MKPPIHRRSVESRVTALRFFEPLERRELLATVTWDGGGDGTTLTDAANWAGDVLPGGGDDAVIDVGGSPAVGLSAGTFAVRTLTVAEHFTMSGGLLRVGAGESVFSGPVTISGGMLSGAGDVAFEGATTWSGGTFAGAGTTTLDAAATMTISGAGMKGLRRDLANNGTVLHTSGLVRLSGAVTLTNAATGHYTVSGSARIDQLGLGNVFDNAGLFTKSSAGASIVLAGFDNSGAVNVTAGTLSLYGNGTNTGARNVAAGATLYYRGNHTHGNGSTFGGSGTYILGGNQLIAVDIAAPNGMKLTGGLSGPGTLTIHSTFFWLNGYLGGSGGVHVTTGGRLIISGGYHQLGREIVNDGALHYLGGSLLFSPGRITNNAGGVMAVLAAATVTAGVGSNVIDNAGTFRKMGSTTLIFGSLNVGVRLNNTGTVEVLDGKLNLAGPITQVVGTTLTGGTWQVQSDAMLYFGSAEVHTIGAGATVTLGGTGAFPPIQELSTINGRLNLATTRLLQLIPSTGTLTNLGTIDLGSRAMLRIVGNYVQTPGATLNVDAGGNSQYSRLVVTGTAGLDGALHFDLASGYTPAPGITFNFFSAGVRIGEFTAESAGTPLLTVQYFAKGVRVVSHAEL